MSCSGCFSHRLTPFHPTALCGVIVTVTVLQRCALELTPWPLKVPTPWTVPYHQLPWPGIWEGGAWVMLGPSCSQKYGEAVIWEMSVSLGVSPISSTFN